MDIEGQGNEDEDEEEEEEEEDDSAEIKQHNLLVPNIELSTGCTPAHLPGSAPSTLAQSLSARLLSLLHSSHLVRARDLQIYGPSSLSEETVDAAQSSHQQELKAYIVLYISITVLSHDGSLFSAIWMALVAALRDTRLPLLTWDRDLEIAVASEEPEKARALRLRGMPVASEFVVFEGDSAGWIGGRRAGGGTGKVVLADPDAGEEDICEEGVCVVVDGGGGAEGLKVLKIEKNGGGFVGVEEMRTCIDLAGERWSEWKKCLERGG